MSYLKKISLLATIGGMLFLTGISAATAQLPWLQDDNNVAVGNNATASPLGPADSLPMEQGMPTPQFGFIPPSPEEIQLQMEIDNEEQAGEVREKAFDAAIKSLMPMTPEEIRKTLDAFKVNREAAEQPVAIPEPKIYVGSVSLDPGAKPLVIQMSAGYVTTFTISDVTGAPWPIQDISFAGDFEIIPPEEGGNVIRITPLTGHGKGNMSIRLVDLRTPVIFTLNTQLEVAHYRFEAQVPENGPLADVPIIEVGGIKTVADSSDLIRFLDGRVPDDAEGLFVDGVDGRTRAWNMNGRVVLRTPLKLLSPGWDNSVSSGDGTRVYSLNDAPVLLLSDRGKITQVHLSTGDISDE